METKKGSVVVKEEERIMEKERMMEEDMMMKTICNTHHTIISHFGFYSIFFFFL